MEVARVSRFGCRCVLQTLVCLSRSGKDKIPDKQATMIRERFKRIKVCLDCKALLSVCTFSRVSSPLWPTKKKKPTGNNGACLGYGRSHIVSYVLDNSKAAAKAGAGKEKAGGAKPAPKAAAAAEDGEETPAEEGQTDGLCACSCLHVPLVCAQTPRLMTQMRLAMAVKRPTRRRLMSTATATLVTKRNSQRRKNSPQRSQNRPMSPKPNLQRQPRHRKCVRQYPPVLALGRHLLLPFPGNSRNPPHSRRVFRSIWHQAMARCECDLRLRCKRIVHFLGRYAR